jgi:hypothetical protein
MRSKAEVGESKQGSASRSRLIFLVGPPGTILSASSASGLCSALASSHDARIQTSRREHSRPIKFGNQHERLHCRLPFRSHVFGLRQAQAMVTMINGRSRARDDRGQLSNQAAVAGPRRGPSIPRRLVCASPRRAPALLCSARRCRHLRCT